MEWDFGDGSTSTDQSPTHRYTIAGRHTVGLEVSGPGGTDTRVMPGLVTVSPGPPVSLEVSPSSAAIAVQRSTQFTAVARDEFGNFVPSEVTWAIAGEGGSISSDGRFTADTVAGAFPETVKAIRADAGELAATASVTVEPGPLSIVVLKPPQASEGSPAEPGVAGAQGFSAEADLLLMNGRVYTVNPEQPWAEAVAVRDGSIVFVGSDEEAERFLGEGTEVIDLGGRMAMPGIHDSHLHLLEAFHAAWTCSLPPDIPPEAYIPMLQQCAPRQVGTDWVIGYGYSIEAMIRHIRSGGRPPVEILDEAIPDSPAVMLGQFSHSVWANSLALAEAGFDVNAEDPPGGVILRDSVTEEPNGLLLDSAGEIMMDLAFGRNQVMDVLNYQAVLRGLEQANRNGITSFADARTYWRRGHVDAYQQVERDGLLTARVILGLYAYPYLDDEEQIATLASMYHNDPGSRLRVSQVKVFSDGEVSHTTAALLQPYSYLGLAGPLGLNSFDEERLTRYITELERVGFDFHIHAIGDRGVHEALNAIEAARVQNGNLDRRHRLTHLEVMAPADVPRFAELGVLADFQMSTDFVLPEYLPFYWWYLGKRRTEERVLRLRDVFDSGAWVVLSSDYDVGELSPFSGMERALTRGEQSLPDIDAAIRAYTVNASYLMQQEDEVGSIEKGKLADIIVLDRNIVEIDLDEVGETKVLLTLLEGEEVWRSPDFASAPTPQSADPALALAPLVDNLVRVWAFNNATQEWTFYDPRPAFTHINTVTGLVTGQPYWIIVRMNQTVTLDSKERTLFAGWNIIVW